MQTEILNQGLDQIFRARSIVLVILMFLVVANSRAIAQTEEMRVLEEVKSLQKQLESASFEERDEAEKKIVQLGIEALDYLADPSDDTSDDFNERLVRIRKTLEKAAISKAISPTSVNIAGTMSVKTLLARIERQTGNKIALPDEYDPSVLEKQVSLELKNASYWKALAEVTTRGGFEVQTYSGASNQTTIVPKQPVDPSLVDSKVDRPTIPTDEAGIFRIRLTRVISSTNLLQPQTDYTKLTLEIQWEPRLTPVSIDLPMGSVEITDADGKVLELSNAEETLSGRVQSGINQIEIPLTLKRLGREVERIGSLKAKLECVVPGRQEKFRFGNLAAIEGEPEISRGGVTVKYLGYTPNEDLFAVSIRVATDPGESLESHLGWVYDNPLFLVDETGKKFHSIGQQGGDVDENGVTIQYFFVEDPAELSLLYESPGAVISVPAEIKLESIPLP